MNTTEPIVDRVCAAFAGYRLRFGTEAMLQDDVESLLSALGWQYVREHWLVGESRIDFYLPEWRVGIECKTDGGQSAVYEQLIRYAAHPSIAGLVLVSRRRTHNLGVAALLEKPFRFHWVGITGV